MARQGETGGRGALCTLAITALALACSGCIPAYTYAAPDRISPRPLIGEKIAVRTLVDKAERRPLFSRWLAEPACEPLSSSFARALVDAGVFAESVHVSGDSVGDAEGALSLLHG